MPSKVDWSKYGPCETCLQDVGEQCINLHTNEPNLHPHSGREKTPAATLE